MSRFLTPLRTEDQSAQVGHIHFVLLEPLVYESTLLQTRVTVPAGTTTDFLSDPQILWNILPPVGEYDEGGVLHDYLYQSGIVSRRIADALLLEAMGCAIHPRWQRYPIWAGVRVGGWVVWNNYRRAEKVSV